MVRCVSVSSPGVIGQPEIAANDVLQQAPHCWLLLEGSHHIAEQNTYTKSASDGSDS